MSIFEFGIDPPAAPVLGQTFVHTPEQKKAFLARYYRDIMTGRRAPPPPPPPRGGGAPKAPSGGGGGGSPNFSQAFDVAKQAPGMAKAVSSVLSSISSGMSTGDIDPNTTANVSINGEFFDDELTWPGHRHYTHMWSYKTSPLGAQDPFTNADFGADEQFWCASNQLPSIIYG